MDFRASFTVRNGTVWRKSTDISVAVSTRKQRTDNTYERVLSIGARSRQRLHETVEDPFSLMGPDEDLARHPYFKVGRPGGCLPDCQIAAVNYSTHTPPAEIERLTSYNFACFTRFNPCTELGDLLPLAWDWHLYPESGASSNLEKQSSLQELRCDIPVWTMARDARYVLLVEALSTEKASEQAPGQDTFKIRLLASLKEPSPWVLGSTTDAYTFAAAGGRPLPEAERVVAGKRFVVFPVGNDRRDQLVTKDSPIVLTRCGVQVDSPKTRRQLSTGFSQNDALSP